jgi:hypothetical protein
VAAVDREAEVVEIRLSSDRGEQRRDQVGDEGRDERREGDADHDPDRDVDEVSAQEELLEVLHRTTPLGSEWLPAILSPHELLAGERREHRPELRPLCASRQCKPQRAQVAVDRLQLGHEPFASALSFARSWPNSYTGRFAEPFPSPNLRLTRRCPPVTTRAVERGAR